MPNDRTRLLLQCTAVAALLMSLSGCDSIRNAVAGKEPPDEFAVVTKAPLIIPPDYNLKPPKPGLAPLNQTSPTESAEAALYGSDLKAAANAISGSYSPAEKMLLAQTGAATASDGIRQQIAADNAQMQSADESFTNQLLFSSPDGSDAPLNADAEKARLDAAKKTAQPAQQPVQQATPPAQQTAQPSQPAQSK
jgi:hypothetical protein